MIFIDNKDSVFCKRTCTFAGPSEAVSQVSAGPRTGTAPEAGEGVSAGAVTSPPSKSTQHRAP